VTQPPTPVLRPLREADIPEVLQNTRRALEAAGGRAETTATILGPLRRAVGDVRLVQALGRSRDGTNMLLLGARTGAERRAIVELLEAGQQLRRHTGPESLVTRAARRGERMAAEAAEAGVAARQTYRAGTSAAREAEAAAIEGAQREAAAGVESAREGAQRSTRTLKRGLQGVALVSGLGGGGYGAYRSIADAQGEPPTAGQVGRRIAFTTAAAAATEAAARHAIDGLFNSRFLGRIAKDLLEGVGAQIAMRGVSQAAVAPEPRRAPATP